MPTVRCPSTQPADPTYRITTHAPYVEQRTRATPHYSRPSAEPRHGGGAKSSGKAEPATSCAVSHFLPSFILLQDTSPSIEWGSEGGRSRLTQSKRAATMHARLFLIFERQPTKQPRAIIVKAAHLEFDSTARERHPRPMGGLGYPSDPAGSRWGVGGIDNRHRAFRRPSCKRSANCPSRPRPTPTPEAQACHRPERDGKTRLELENRPRSGCPRNGERHSNIPRPTRLIPSANGTRPHPIEHGPTPSRPPPRASDRRDHAPSKCP